MQQLLIEYIKSTWTKSRLCNARPTVFGRRQFSHKYCRPIRTELRRLKGRGAFLCLEAIHQRSLPINGDSHWGVRFHWRSIGGQRGNLFVFPFFCNARNFCKAHFQWTCSQKQYFSLTQVADKASLQGLNSWYWMIQKEIRWQYTRRSSHAFSQNSPCTFSFHHFLHFPACPAYSSRRRYCN